MPSGPLTRANATRRLRRAVDPIGNLLSEAFHLLGLFAIGAATVWAAAAAFVAMIAKGHASLEDLLLLFIYLEIGSMVGIYFKTNHMPVRFLIYVGITALTRHLIVVVQSEAAPDAGILILAGGTLVMALAVLVVRFASFHYPSESEKGDEAGQDAYGALRRVYGAPPSRHSAPQRRSASIRLREPAVAQDCLALRADRTRRPADFGRRARKARRRRRLRRAVDVDEGPARDVVGMARRFVHVEDRRDAGVGIGKQRRPFVARPFGEGRFEPRPERRPGARVPAVGELACVELELVDERIEELRLQRADRDPLAVGAAIDAVERRAAVEDVGLPLAAPEPSRLQAVGHRHQQADAVGHRRVDDLSAPRAPRLDERADDAEGEKHRAAAEVADEVERRDRRILGRRSRAARRSARCS